MKIFDTNEPPMEPTAYKMVLVVNICEDRDKATNTALYEQFREEVAAVVYSEKYAPLFARVVYG